MTVLRKASQNRPTTEQILTELRKRGIELRDVIPRREPQENDPPAKSDTDDQELRKLLPRR
jgi:hypothetical protein